MSKAAGVWNFVIGFVFTLVLVAAIWLATPGCSKQVAHLDPARDLYPSSRTAQLGAVAHVHAGEVVEGPVHGHSMGDLISTGDWIVVRVIRFEQVTLGKIYAYDPSQGGGVSVPPSVTVHRAIDKDDFGYIMAGDTAPVDKNTRLTAQNIIGEVAYIGHVELK